ncbi:MAG: aldo/keto reductase [Treponema sp.]|jgi:aryl-alcohol dehydrogenase-like predicted oxidoreductase|nr:aldo/keto reductase [Treponema sp.]
MKYVRLRNTSLELSNICLGVGSFGTSLDESRAFETMDAFVESGGNFVDTANIYGKWEADKQNHSEQMLSKWIKSRNAIDKIIVGTKGGHYDLDTPDLSRVNKRDIQKDLEESLKTLGLDHIDFYWLHRDDENKPIGEIIGTMEEFVLEGKIRYYGASNYKLNRMKEALEYSQKNNCQGFSAISNQWSLADKNPEVKANSDPTLAAMTKEFYQWHKETKMPLVPYSATASGFFEKYYKMGAQLPEYIKQAYYNEKNIKIYEELLKLKEKYNVSVYTLSLACLLNRSFDTIPISSVRNIEQLNGFLQASDILVEEDIIETDWFWKE